MKKSVFKVIATRNETKDIHITEGVVYDVYDVKQTPKRGLPLFLIYNDKGAWVYANDVNCYFKPFIEN